VSGPRSAVPGEEHHSLTRGGSSGLGDDQAHSHPPGTRTRATEAPTPTHDDTPASITTEYAALPADVRDRVGFDGDCLVWLGPVNGRRRYAADRKGRLLHRSLWTRFGFALPDDHWLVRWVCQNNRCVRPSHLRVVSFSEWHTEFRRRNASLLPPNPETGTPVTNRR